MGYILHFLYGMLPWWLAFTLLYLPLRRLFLRRKGRPADIRREILLFLFFFFLVGVSSQTVLCSLSTFSPENLGKRLSLLPGTILRRMKISPYSAIIGFWGNLLLLLPLGFLSPLLWKRARCFPVICGGALLSLSFEIMQLPLARSTDIDDLLLNTAGAAAGYFLHLPFRRVLCRRERRAGAVGGKKAPRDRP